MTTTGERVPVPERYPVGTVLHGLEIVAYVPLTERRPRRSGTRAYVVAVRCPDCGDEWAVRLNRLVTDRAVCNCVLRTTPPAP